MKKRSFIARVPDRPGELSNVTRIIKKYGANINRIHYDHRIDPEILFFEITADSRAEAAIAGELADKKYLQTLIKIPQFIKVNIYLPNTPGALLSLLEITTKAGANIYYADFDEKGPHRDFLTIGFAIGEESKVNELLNNLKSEYKLDILEYDTSGQNLDDTVFYVKFAQELRRLMKNTDEDFLLKLLGDIDHIVQELTVLGKDPKKVFDSILETGRMLRASAGELFYSEVQKVAVSPELNLFCFQLPCGGNIFVFQCPDETVLLDTGYGLYYAEVKKMFEYYRINCDNLSRIIITHADADHYGAAGRYSETVLMHPSTLEIMRETNRAYGSKSQDSVLEAVYTKIINLLSEAGVPEKYRLLETGGRDNYAGFPVSGKISIGNVEFYLLESLGGHLRGQLYLAAPEAGLLFTGDTVINFDSISPERAGYNALAEFLMTSVNVDSGKAREEREKLLSLARELEAAMNKKNKSCFICGGHGAISVLREGRLAEFGNAFHYGPPAR